MDWLKGVKETAKKAEARKTQTQQQTPSGQDQAEDKAWLDRLMRKVQEASQEGFFIHVKRTPKQFELFLKGRVSIESIAPQGFAITYRNVLKPSNLIFNRPIIVYHHRLVKLRELNDHNIEEILKFVILGMERYCEAAKFSRIERNLKHVIEINNVDERV
jgi:hypothetical protein